MAAKGKRPSSNEPMATVPVRLSEDLRDALRRRAREEERPVSILIRRALRRYLEGDAS
jgi:predicted transcriptional regulator